MNHCDMYANISLPLRNQPPSPVLLLLVMDAVPMESTVADTAPAVMDIRRPLLCSGAGRVVAYLSLSSKTI